MYHERFNNVCKLFGAAANNAQLFEADLISFLILDAVHRAKADFVAWTVADVTDADPFALKSRRAMEEHIRDFMKNAERELEEKTLGQLLKRCKISGRQQDLWQKALDRRNELMHGFFWRNSDRLGSKRGCIEIEQELREAALLFGEADAAVGSAIEDQIGKMGMDMNEWRATVKDELKKLLG